jgi:hypothetical protein
MAVEDAFHIHSMSNHNKRVVHGETQAETERAKLQRASCVLMPMGHLCACAASYAVTDDKQRQREKIEC